MSKSLLIAILVLSCFVHSEAQDSSFIKEHVTVKYIKKKHQRETRYTKAPKTIDIWLYEKFNDTIQIAVDDSVLVKYYISTDSITWSSSFSGIIFHLPVTEKKSYIKISLLKEKKYINFKIVHRRHYYELHRSSERNAHDFKYMWYVNGMY